MNPLVFIMLLAATIAVVVVAVCVIVLAILSTTREVRKKSEPTPPPTGDVYNIHGVGTTESVDDILARIDDRHRRAGGAS